MKSQDVFKYESLLQEHGYRITQGRVALLKTLDAAHEPLTSSDLYKKMKGTLDKVTLYRALDSFVESKIVVKVNLHENASYYEFFHEDNHHHHIVCKTCGKIEGIELCEDAELHSKVLNVSKSFKEVNSHSLEFFGVCHTCSQK